MKRILSLFIFLLIAASGYAQTRIPMPYAKIQFFDRNGRPLAGGRLWSYVAGTTTPKSTYTSSTGGANTNPVILDASGRANVWMDATTSYKFILEDSTCTYVLGQCHGVQQWSVDNITDYGALLSSGSTALAGDVTGSLSTTVVSALQGRSVSSTAPEDGQVLTFVTSQWEPGAVDLADTDAVTGILPSTNGGTANGFTAFTGPATSAKTFTLPNASDTVATYAVKNVFTKAQIVTPAAALTVAGDGTIATDASLSNWFRVTLTTDCPCTLSTPTNPTNGQIATWEVIQAAGGSETLAYSAAFGFGTVVTTPTITITADKRDFITATYNSTSTKWYVLYVTQGY